MTRDPAVAGTVTLADVARAAGVSVATASFVLSGRGGSRSAGSAATKAKVREAAAELGYVPNRHAQAMRTGRGGGIVLTLGTLDDPWAVQLTSQVRDDALAHDLSTLVLADERWFEYLVGASADGAFVTSIDFVDGGVERMRRLAAATQTGLVAFSAVMEPESFDVVSSTPVLAIHRAYARLRERHDRVQMLAPDLGHRAGGTFANARARAFLDAARETGDGPAEQLVHVVPGGSHDTYLAAVEWLSGPDRPEAVVCHTGYQAVALRLAAARVGISVPEDLEFISIGDVPANSEFFGPISYYGVDDVFARLSSIIIGRATDREDRPGVLHSFDWEFFPGTTTRDHE
ncbi:LacI family DNA-binding transcriptional regulator [Brachybacterium sp. AOP43-C2-M15]|uniref:LacI family DNA-binding transcriptional regulator n=1 Tax=Brachybacterium sp. AOP43-C2-M15 TaxID=3457661 RepID=UPI00403331FA